MNERQRLVLTTSLVAPGINREIWTGGDSQLLDEKLPILCHIYSASAGMGYRASNSSSRVLGITTESRWLRVIPARRIVGSGYESFLWYSHMFEMPSS